MKLIFKILIVLFYLVPVSAQEQETFRNPILKGFYPDPSICRVGDTFYMVTSSFEWFPGLPIFKSKDLVNWEQIGHVLDRPSQLQMKEGMKSSHGLWAPTIRYNNGIYYVICTATGAGGNFLVTAQQPEGPYSEPVFIEDAPGIDPSLFFEDDGSVWYAGGINGSDKVPPRQYPAEDRIYIQQIDVKTGKFIGERHIVTSGYAINSPYAEAPHIYKINEKYYLVVAEGGTWENHAVTMFTADSIVGPYTPFICNPVLTHRHLGNNIDITTIGHADLVETPSGEWYSVMLGVRPIEGYNMFGRETFLTKVTIEGGQPIFNAGVGRVLMEDKRPDLPWSPVPTVPSRDDFNENKLQFYWNFLRTPFEEWYTLENGNLVLKLRPNTSKELTNPSFIARRLQDPKFSATTKMSFSTKSDKEEAGILLYKNERFQYRLVLTSKYILKLIQVKDGVELVVSEKYIETKAKDIILRVEGNNLIYNFSYGTNEDNLIPIGEEQDATICSTNIAKGFTGIYIGMYASSNGNPSNNFAKFDWFEYKQVD